MAKYYRSIQAGRYRCDYTYSRVSRYDCDKARSEKRKASSAAQKVVNDKQSRIQLTGILAENFIDDPDSFFVTLTMDDQHYPGDGRNSSTRAVMERSAINYLDRLRYIGKKRGKEIYSLWAIGIGEGGRYHIHFVLRGPTAEDIRDCWKLGNVDYHSLYSDQQWMEDKARGWWSSGTKAANPIQIAKYLMQNGNDRPVGKHPWHASRNCKRPRPQPARIVPDSRNIDAPEGAEILDKIEHSTIYGSYMVIEYILPADSLPARPAVTGSGSSGKNKRRQRG